MHSSKTKLTAVSGMNYRFAICRFGKGRNKIMSVLCYDRELLHRLQQNYMTAKALEETLIEQMNDIQEHVLYLNVFNTDDEFVERGREKRIKNPQHTYLLSDSDFNIFLDKCYEIYKRKGIADKRGKEYVPYAEAMTLRKESEKMLIKYGLEIIPYKTEAEKETFQTLQNAVKNVEYRDKILNLILRLE